MGFFEHLAEKGAVDRDLALRFRKCGLFHLLLNKTNFFTLL